MYIFNKERKRLEPTETKCQFCETGNSTSMEDNYFVPLFKENDRTNVTIFAIWGIWGIFGIFGGLIIGFAGSWLLQVKFVSDKGIYTQEEGAKQNEAVHDLVINGWSLKQPTA